MPVIITKEDIDYYLIPAPLVSFNKQNYNNIGRPGFGTDYSIQLQGELLQMYGNPYSSGNSVGIADSSNEWTTTSEIDYSSLEFHPVSGVNLLDTTIKKQEKIRSLFTNPVVSGVAKPIKVTIRGLNEGVYGSGLSFQAFVDDISFDSDGNWANPVSYNIGLRTSNFLSSANDGEFDPYHNETKFTYSISSLSETFDINEDGQQTLTFDNNYQFLNTNKVYTVNRSVSAVGTPVYDESGSYVSGLAPWQQASGYIYEYLNLTELPETKSIIYSLLGSGNYNIANVVYNENIDREAGSYNLTETYIAYSGVSPVIETINIDVSLDESRTKLVTVNGSINGLNTVNGFESSGNMFNNAKTYWDSISTGVPPLSYYYAQAVLPSSGWLHPSPLNNTFAYDFAGGNISYSYSFDDRPPNIIPGSVSETISIDDTYPGEIFSVTPVIGRSQPVLQYLNSRSEYKRSLSIDVVMGNPTVNWNTTIGSDVNSSGTLSSGVAQSILQGLHITNKPSITNTDEFNIIYQAANPVNDPNFTVVSGKCFHSAPTESWNPKTRSYTYSIEWTFEKA